MAERTGSPTATYEALLGRSRLQSLQYDVAQAGKIRGQRDNLMTRMQGLDKQLYSFEQGKSFGRGGGWAAWTQAMSGVFKIQAGEKQNIRKIKNERRSKLYEKSEKNQTTRDKYIQSLPWQRTAESTQKQWSKKADTAAEGTALAKQFISRLIGKATGQQKETSRPIAYKYAYDMVQGMNVGGNIKAGALAHIRDQVLKMPDAGGRTPDQYLQMKLPIYDEDYIDREVDRIGGGIPGLDKYKRFLLENQPTGGMLMGTAAPKATDSVQNKQKFFGQTYQVSPDGRTVTYIGPQKGTKAYAVQQALEATGQEDPTTFEKGKAIPYDQAVKQLAKQNATLSKKTIIAGIKSEKDALQGRIAELDKQIAKTPYVSSAEYSYRTTPYAPVMLRRGVSQGVAAKAARRVRGAEEAKGERIEAQADLADANIERMKDAVERGDAGTLLQLQDDQKDLLAEMFGTDDPSAWGESGKELSTLQRDAAVGFQQQAEQMMEAGRFTEAKDLLADASSLVMDDPANKVLYDELVPLVAKAAQEESKKQEDAAEVQKRVQSRRDRTDKLAVEERERARRIISGLSYPDPEPEPEPEPAPAPAPTPLDYDPYEEALRNYERALSGQPTTVRQRSADRILGQLNRLGKQTAGSAQKYKDRFDAARRKHATWQRAVDLAGAERRGRLRRGEGLEGAAIELDEMVDRFDVDPIEGGTPDEQAPIDMVQPAPPPPAPKEEDITFGEATDQIKLEEPKANRPRAKPPKAKAKPSDAESRRLFKEGRRLYEADDFEGASRAFADAFAQLPEGANQKIRDALAYNVNEAQKRIAEAKAAANPAPTTESAIPDIAQPTTLKGFDAYSRPFQIAIYSGDKEAAESILKQMRQQAKTFFAGELGPGDREVVQQRLARYARNIQDLGDSFEDEDGDTGDFGDTGDSDDDLLKKSLNP